MPFYTNFFDSIYHVDVFYDWTQLDMRLNCKEFFKALKPGGSIVCGMELKKLRKLEGQGILSEEEYEPMRYMEQLEKAGFQNIQVVFFLSKNNVLFMFINLGLFFSLSTRKSMIKANCATARKMRSKFSLFWQANR